MMITFEYFLTYSKLESKFCCLLNGTYYL